MSVTGKWVNSFGSLAYLTQQSGGAVVGVYSSTTGSSGIYWVLGFTDPNPSSSAGQSLALSIFWRSVQGGKGDPSWHYVSGFSGQLITLNNVPTLSLMHDMVATTPFPGVVPVTGNFMDKLLYTPYTGGNQAPAQWPPKFSSPPGNVVDGNWICVQDPSIQLSLTVQDPTFGYLIGTLQTANGSVPLAGFTDTYAGVDGLQLQGLTVSALLPDGHSVVSLAGSLDLQQGVLTMAWFQGVGTSAKMTWIETNLQGLNFNQVN
jgi:saccharopepsin